MLTVVALAGFLSPTILLLTLAYLDEREAKRWTSIEEFDRMRDALAPPSTR